MNDEEALATLEALLDLAQGLATNLSPPDGAAHSELTAALAASRVCVLRFALERGPTRQAKANAGERDAISLPTHASQA